MGGLGPGQRIGPHGPRSIKPPWYLNLGILTNREPLCAIS